MPRVTRVVADNPSPFTGPGTNTWIIAEEPVAVVIDPGPDDDRHLAAIEARLRGLPVGLVLVTHSHPDHLPLAERLAGRHRARVLRHPELADGDLLQVGRVRLRALYTPGHAPDHFCFLIEEDGALFSGDLVLGRGSTMITYPEGDVGRFIDSLDRISGFDLRIIFPGHWDPITSPAAKLAEYRAHRLEREAMIASELERGGPGSAAELTRRVYGAEVSGEELMRAAEMTLKAHLRKLEQEGRVRVEAGGAGEEVYHHA